MSDNIFMNILKGNAFRMVAALVVLGSVSGATLVVVYNYAMPRIKVNVDNETNTAIKKIFPDSGSTVKTEMHGVYNVRGGDGKDLGFAFLAQGNGYQGIIKLIVGIDAALKEIKGIEVLESQETPGLGAEISSESFKKQFVGLVATRPIEYLKNRKPQEPYQIEAITGATISSRAVVNILNKRVEEIRRSLGVRS